VSSTTGRVGEAATKLFTLFRTGAAHWTGTMTGTSHFAEVGFKGAVCDAAPRSNGILLV
jgi:hypothetical protein